jgi:DNA polymerase
MIVGAMPRTFEELCNAVRACRACASMNHCHVLSAANGRLDARVLFVAEAPGRLGAARTGVPMTSDMTGRRFEKFLRDAGLWREDVFVTNAVLCNPLSPAGNNRPPRTSEIAACSGFLASTIEMVQAPLVVALGVAGLRAIGRIEAHGVQLARDAGRPIAWRDRTLVALYHPSVQSTMSRPHDLQCQDWRKLGQIIASAQGTAA